jgi:hypothetical protein
MRAHANSNDSNIRYYAKQCCSRLQQTTYRLSRNLEYLELPAVERARQEDTHRERRKMTIHEIYTTEKTYVHALVSLQTVCCGTAIANVSSIH